MRYKYCPKCGTLLSEKLAGDDGMVPFCVPCNKYWFDTFSSSVMVMTYNEFNEVVLARQNYISTKYDVFTTGYITPGETAEQTAFREVEEELGIQLESIEYGGTYWVPQLDILQHAFLGYAPKQDLHLSVEVDSAEWAPLSEVLPRKYPTGPGEAGYELYQKLVKKLNDE